MKKVILFLVGLVFILLVIFGVVFYKIQEKDFYKNLNIDFDNINLYNCFFEYEKNNKKHILFKVGVNDMGSYNIKITKVKIVSKEYDGNILNLKLEIKTKYTTRRTIRKPKDQWDEVYDPGAFDSTIMDIEVNDNLESLIVDTGDGRGHIYRRYEGDNDSNGD